MHLAVAPAGHPPDGLEVALGSVVEVFGLDATGVPMYFRYAEYQFLEINFWAVAKVNDPLQTRA